MTWDIALGIFALCAFVLSIIGLTSKLSTAIATLNTTVQNLNKTIDGLKENNKEAHKEMYQRLNKHDKTLVDHERRIQNLEGDEKQT